MERFNTSDQDAEEIQQEVPDSEDAVKSNKIIYRNLANILN